MPPKQHMKIKFIYGVTLPRLHAQAEALIKNATKATSLELTREIKTNGIDLDSLLILANQTRLNDPIKYGTIPFIGKSSVERHIFEGIEGSTCGKTIKSGFDAVSRLSNVDAKPADSLTYFLVTPNRVPLEEGSDDSDIEVYEDGTKRKNIYIYSLLLRNNIIQYFLSLLLFCYITQLILPN